MAKIGLWNYVKLLGFIFSDLGQLGKGLNTVLAKISMIFTKLKEKNVRCFTKYI